MKVNGLILLILLLNVFACNNSLKEEQVDPIVNMEAEKVAILSALNNETKAAFQRDFEGWKNYWVHDPNMSKTYMNFVDDSFSESIGWSKISEFVETFLKEHPEPEPVPELLKEIDVQLYGDGAWVSYEQLDSIRGLKRETRLMVKREGQWKIAGMHTSIYGPQ